MADFIHIIAEIFDSSPSFVLHGVRRGYLCIWVTFLTGLNIRYVCVCVCNCAAVPFRNVQINMNFRATVDKPNGWTNGAGS